MATQEDQLLVPLESYLKSGIHIGTKFRTKSMSSFIYKVRADGLAVLNIQEIDKRLQMAAKLLSTYKPEDVLVVCRRENGWDVVDLFSKATGVKALTKRYAPGILTNPNLKTFTEAKLVLIVDPWPDRNVVLDAAKIGVPILTLCDTNNESNYVDFIVPCNNKGKKSLAMIFYILAREYTKAKGMEFNYALADFDKE